ncbi:MAG: hypothetical protein RLZZ528_2636 [Pseudomonadota bacterium]
MPDDLKLTAAEILPEDPAALLVGRVWSEAAGGPCPVLVRGGIVHDLSGLSPTMADLLETGGLAGRLAGDFPSLGPLDGFFGAGGGRGTLGALLAPCDLQPVKAAGVTFAGSMIERVIEERAKGDPARADAIRRDLAGAIGANLRGVVPGSENAARVKAILQDKGLWSQYLEVGIGPDAEIFTKAPPMASLGCGATLGLNPVSRWNNPEPEVVLAVRSDGRIVGAALGNDVNLRDVEGRSALLLGKAKDNNGSCAIGPFIRLFDGNFTLDSLSRLTVSLTINGPEGFLLQGTSRMSEISRAPADIAAQALNACHQYPDGMMLFLGTMFAPTQDREAGGQGFTHREGDRVTIHAPELGRLSNLMSWSDRIDPWTFGTRALMQNLARRQLL